MSEVPLEPYERLYIQTDEEGRAFIDTPALRDLLQHIIDFEPVELVGNLDQNTLEVDFRRPMFSSASEGSGLSPFSARAPIAAGITTAYGPAYRLKAFGQNVLLTAPPKGLNAYIAQVRASTNGNRYEFWRDDWHTNVYQWGVLNISFPSSPGQYMPTFGIWPIFNYSAGTHGEELYGVVKILRPSGDIRPAIAACAIPPVGSTVLVVEGYHPYIDQSSEVLTEFGVVPVIVGIVGYGFSSSGINAPFGYRYSTLGNENYLPGTATATGAMAKTTLSGIYRVRHQVLLRYQPGISSASQVRGHIQAQVSNPATGENNVKYWNIDSTTTYTSEPTLTSQVVLWSVPDTTQSHYTVLNFSYLFHARTTTTGQPGSDNLRIWLNLNATDSAGARPGTTDSGFYRREILTEIEPIRPIAR